MSDISTTSIGQMKDNEYYLRGQALSTLIEKMDFVSALWLTWNGKAPDESERKVMNACLVACLDHGVEPPSPHVTRVVASCGKSLADAVAAGLLTLGSRHGNAITPAAWWFKKMLEEKVTSTVAVTETLAQGKHLAGFGHPEYKAIDPRAQSLFRLVRSCVQKTPCLDFAEQVAQELTLQKGKSLPLNIDGAIGAIVVDLGLPPDMGDAIFISGRTIGLLAHALEVSRESKGYSRA